MTNSCVVATEAIDNLLSRWPARARGLRFPWSADVGVLGGSCSSGRTSPSGTVGTATRSKAAQADGSADSAYDSKDCRLLGILPGLPSSSGTPLEDNAMRRRTSYSKAPTRDSSIASSNLPNLDSNWTILDVNVSASRRQSDPYEVALLVAAIPAFAGLIWCPSTFWMV